MSTLTPDEASIMFTLLPNTESLFVRRAETFAGRRAGALDKEYKACGYVMLTLRTVDRIHRIVGELAQASVVFVVIQVKALHLAGEEAAVVILASDQSLKACVLTILAGRSSRFCRAMLIMSTVA